MKRGPLRTAVASAALTLTCAGAASGQISGRVAAAEELFHTGRALITQHKYKEACEKLAASQKLDPAVGTLFSFAECSIGQGKTATAWLSYERAVALAHERSDPRSVAAEERATAVEPLLSRLVLRMTDDAPPADLRIVVNGETLGLDVLRAPMPLDPGATTVVVSAPGYRVWSTHIQIGAVADTVEVAIPRLETAPDPSEVARERARAKTKRTAGLAVGGLGVVAVGVGAILGMQAIVNIRDANRLCPDPTCTNTTGGRENATGRSLADASSVVVPAGVALIAAGALLYFTTHDPRAPEVAADVGANGARVRLGWSW